jgi:hypothetical protein
VWDFSPANRYGKREWKDRKGQIKRIF